MLKITKKLLLLTCVIALVISTVGCVQPGVTPTPTPTPTPDENVTYDVVSYQISDVVDLPSEAQEVLDGEREYSVEVFLLQSRLDEYIVNVFGGEAPDGFDVTAGEGNIVLAVYRYGVSKEYCTYTGFRSIYGGPFCVDLLVYTYPDRVEQYWLDFVVIPKSSVGQDVVSALLSEVRPSCYLVQVG